MCFVIVVLYPGWWHNRLSFVSVDPLLADLFIAPELFFNLLFSALLFCIFLAHLFVSMGVEKVIFKGVGEFSASPLHLLNTSAVQDKSLRCIPAAWLCRLADRWPGIGPHSKSGKIGERQKRLNLSPFSRMKTTSQCRVTFGQLLLWQGICAALK